MNRFALAALALVVAPAAVSAQVGGYYVAVPAAAPTKPSLMTHATFWSLKNGTYVAARAAERDTVLCELVARNVGTLVQLYRRAATPMTPMRSPSATQRRNDA